MHSYGLTEKLWIDSVSINQEDNDEKGFQVALMGDIFSRAEKVLVWLDKASEVSLSARWASSLREDWPIGIAGAIATLDKLKWIEEPWVKYRLLLAWREEVRHILFHPYWRRLWIVQEVWQGRQVLVIAGLCTVDLSYMSSLDALFFSENLWAPPRTAHDIGYYLFHDMDNGIFPKVRQCTSLKILHQCT